MKKLGVYLTLICFIIFEAYAGVCLLTNPEEFTNTAVIVFGIFMLLAGVFSIFSALKMKSQNRAYNLELFGGVLDLIIGVLCVIFNKSIVKLLPGVMVIIGIMMIIAGIHKIRNYMILKDLGVKRSWLIVLSAILTIVLGVIVCLNPFAAQQAAWTTSGIFLIVMAVVDLFVVIFSLFV